MFIRSMLTAVYLDYESCFHTGKINYVRTDGMLTA